LAVLLLVSCTAVPASAGGNQLANSWAAINYATAGAIALGALQGGPVGVPVAPGWGGGVVGPAVPVAPVWGFPALRPGVVVVPGPGGWEARQAVRGCVPARWNPYIEPGAPGAVICGGQFAR
jgi:hypothetical protein